MIFLPEGGTYGIPEKTLVAPGNDGVSEYTVGAPSRRGYVFSCWKVAGTTVEVQPGDTVKFVTTGTGGEASSCLNIYDSSDSLFYSADIENGIILMCQRMNCWSWQSQVTLPSPLRAVRKRMGRPVRLTYQRKKRRQRYGGFFWWPSWPWPFSRRACWRIVRVRRFRKP